ncbi:hypothetical protein ACFSE1_08355 [Rhizobium helianthi]|uniref:Uncharacterized protein n=1 Tax=Rhizobium helianthi TaxID=1132695 RepID=A0ABW4M2W6_9HYPH
MNSRLPPIPEENRSDKGNGEAPVTDKGMEAKTDPGSKNFDRQGRQGNIKVNTTNQGYQQDR